jgi:LysM repeat protein
VKSGDNLTRIASLHQLGKNGVKALLAANKDVLHDANMLREGMKLKIPAAGSAHAETAAHDSAPVPGQASGHAPEHAPRDGAHGGSGDYTVQAGDTLERIARRVLNDGQRWKDILEWNKDKISEPTKIRVGMVLHMKGTEVRTEAGSVRGYGNTIRADYDPPAPQARDREVHTEPPPEPETADMTAFPVSASRSVPQPKQPAAATRNQIKDPNPAPRIPAPDGDVIP